MVTYLLGIGCIQLEGKDCLKGIFSLLIKLMRLTMLGVIDNIYVLSSCLEVIFK